MRRFITPLVLAILAASAHAETPHPTVTHIRTALAAYHADSHDNDAVLRVIYFVPKDVEPQADYRPRLTRIMRDMQSFFRDEMQRNGFGPTTFSLETEDDQVKVHLVRGRKDHTQYSHESGNETVREIRDALRGTINLDLEFVLIIHGMCTKREDGSYFFYAPYYGDGSSNQIRGLCHAADCELLDPQLLTDTEHTVKYNEHYGDYSQSLAEFNTKYLGGIVHEMGHGFGLPHNTQTPKEKRTLGTALMGAGNHTYRNETRGKKGSFLTRASAARLASHPLFSHKDTERFDNATCDITNLAFSRDKQTLAVTGQVTASPDAYAVIAYLDPDGRRDYDAATSISTTADNTFTLTTTCTRPGHHDLRLTVLHLNGATTTHKFQFNADENKQPDTDYLTAQQLRTDVIRALRAGNPQKALTLARNLLRKQDTPDLVREQMKHLVAELTDHAKPVDLAHAAGQTVPLSTINWQSAQVGWGKPTRDFYNLSPRTPDPLFIELDKTFYTRGLYAHAPSTYSYSLAGRFKRFTATVGLQDGHADNGSAVFVLIADDKEIYRSDLLKSRDTRAIDIPITGVKNLKLIVETGKDDNAHCWSVWADPTLHR